MGTNDLVNIFLEWIMIEDPSGQFIQTDGSIGPDYPNSKEGLLFLLNHCSCIHAFSVSEMMHFQHGDMRVIRIEFFNLEEMFDEDYSFQEMQELIKHDPLGKKFDPLEFGTLDNNFEVTNIKPSKFQRKDGSIVDTFNPVPIFNFQTILRELTEHIFSRISKHKIEKFLLDKVG